MKTIPELGLIFSFVLLTSCASLPQTNEPAAEAVLESIKDTAPMVNTFSADFSYAVTSARRQQLIVGKVLMMKPNFLRITYSYMAHPAFPNPMVSDGERIYTFTPNSFLPNRTFSNEPFDPILGANYASGLLKGGGTISSSVAAANGQNIHLWDAIPLQAFFDPTAALHYLYYRNLGEVKSEGEKTIDDINYRVLYHHFQNGNIAGGESSDFDQHLYVGPDNLIHMYVLEFTSAGNRGVQVMRFKNIKTNLPLTKADFVFTPPSDITVSK